MKGWSKSIAWALFVFCSGLFPGSLCVASDDGTDVFELGLEQLMDIEVYSVSKKQEPLGHAAAAVFVLTHDDIRRSGAQSLPALLRMVPGLHVAQFNSNAWSVSSRGFNGRFSNKLLVLIDGRTVYTPVFSGVFWNEKDALLEDIDRIEVIRGPGGTLWGANAVNGVINIITKSAKNTKGVYATVGGGTEERSLSGVRYGTALGDQGALRVYAKHYDRDDSRRLEGGDAFDQTSAGQGGFRSDWVLSEQDTLTIQGDVFGGSEQTETFLPSRNSPALVPGRKETTFRGLNLLGRWERSISDQSNLSVQFYYDRTDRTNILADFVVDTFDLELQHSFAAADGVNFTWGGGYRAIEDNGTSSDIVSVGRGSRSFDIASGFVQVEYDLIPEAVVFSAGTKLEHNDFTGLEVQPNARVVWTAADGHTVWGAYSRAVRTPSRINDELAADFGVVPLPGGAGVSSLRVMGNPDARSEVLNAYEVGYRFTPFDRVQFDIASFVFDYSDLQTLEFGAPSLGQSGGVVTPLTYDNKAEARSFGGEVALTTQPWRWWRLQGTYSFFDLDVRLDTDSTDILSEGEEDQNPRNQFGLRSMLDLTSDLQLDSFLRYVDSLGGPGVDSYVELDVRLGYRLSDQLELSLVGTNLLHDHHQEFYEGALSPVSTNLQRGVLGQIVWRMDRR